MLALQITQQRPQQRQPKTELDLPFDTTSAAVGLAVGIAVGALLGRALKGRLSRLLWVLITIGVMVAGTSAYLGWIRARTGLTDKPELSSPLEILEDAKKAAKQVNKHHRVQRQIWNDLKQRPAKTKEK